MSRPRRSKKKNPAGRATNMPPLMISPNQEKVFSHLVELFSMALDEAVIYSVAQSCNFKCE
jgi:hypothetical protein